MSNNKINNINNENGGTININSLKNKNLKYYIIGISIISLIALFFKDTNDSQIINTTNGNNSPNISTASGDVSVKYTTVNQISSIKIKDLYPNILRDYIGISKEKFIQDFGQPFKKNDREKWSNTAGIILKNHWEYIYNFKSGIFTIYFDKSTDEASAIQVELYRNKQKQILLPYEELDIDFTLGKSKFKDIFDFYTSTPDKIYLQGGNDYGTYFIDFAYYLGREGGYKTYIFGIHPDGFDVDDIEKNIKIIENRKPDYLIIVNGLPEEEYYKRE